VTQGRSLLDDYRASLKTADLVVLSDYAKGSLTGVARFIELACAAGKNEMKIMAGMQARSLSCLKPLLQ
jgi:bifunctional ADP-heptose synthase (sugar kinase/adenylyltransferase)